MKRKLAVALIVLTMIGCKPVQTVQERYVTTVDSTAVATLNEMLEAQMKENEHLRTSLERTREDVVQLSNEIHTYTINYDITASLDTATGRYPVASETITSNKSLLENTVKEHATIVREYEKEVKAIMSRSRNLEYQIEALREENSELKSKKAKCGFSFKWLIYGIVTGSILSIFGLALWKMK